MRRKKKKTLLFFSLITLFLIVYLSQFSLGENSQIASYCKLCCNLPLFRKYVGIYHFLGTRVWRNWVFHGPRVYGTWVPWKIFEIFLRYSSSINSSTIKNFQKFSKYIFSKNSSFWNSSFTANSSFTNSSLKSGRFLHIFRTMVDC